MKLSTKNTYKKFYKTDQFVNYLLDVILLDKRFY